MTTSFSTTAFEPQLNTLKDLDDSGLPIILSSGTVENLFGDEPISVLASLQAKFHLSDDSALERVATDRDMCGIERLSDVNIIIKVVTLYLCERNTYNIISYRRCLNRVMVKVQRYM